MELNNAITMYCILHLFAYKGRIGYLDIMEH